MRGRPFDKPEQSGRHQGSNIFKATPFKFKKARNISKRAKKKQTKKTKPKKLCNVSANTKVIKIYNLWGVRWSYLAVLRQTHGPPDREAERAVLSPFWRTEKWRPDFWGFSFSVRRVSMIYQLTSVFAAPSSKVCFLSAETEKKWDRTLKFFVF